MIHLHIKFDTSASNGSFVSDVKLKPKEIFCMATMLLFYSLQNKLPQQKMHILLPPTIHYLRILHYVVVMSF